VKLHNPIADVFIPDKLALREAMARVTHLGVGAHQDDLEFMAFQGIHSCYHSETNWFAGVTCTNGSGSARAGAYATYSDEEMMAVRGEEQRQAAMIGRYAAMIQLNYPSKVAKDPNDSRLKADLLAILMATHPEVVYTHNPADKHETHIAVVIPVIQAIRELPLNERPQAVHGCEMWRNLDWMPDSEKVVHDMSGHENLAAALNGLFDSQIAGGKRYDLAVLGRRRANATFFESHGIDQSESIALAMDLTPRIRDEPVDLVDYVTSFIDKFRADVVNKIRARLGR